MKGCGARGVLLGQSFVFGVWEYKRTSAIVLLRMVPTVMSRIEYAATLISSAYTNKQNEYILGASRIPTFELKS